MVGDRGLQCLPRIRRICFLSLQAAQVLYKDMVSSIPGAEDSSLAGS